MPKRKLTPNQIANLINTEFPDVIIRTGDELANPYDLRRPCGIASLDIATGGGMPAGTYCQIDGPEGIGKDFLLWRYVAKCQAIYGKDAAIVWLAIEPIDLDFGRSIGAQIAYSDYDLKVYERRNGVKLTPSEKREMKKQLGFFHVIQATDSYENMLDSSCRFIESNQIQLMIINSWDALLTEGERDKELEENAKVASTASLQTRWMKKALAASAPKRCCPNCGAITIPAKKGKGFICTEKCSDAKYGDNECIIDINETTVLAVQQLRAKGVGGGWTGRGRKYGAGGAWALKHYKAISLSLHKSSYTLEKDEKVAKEVKWEIAKGKAGIHEGAKGTYQYDMKSREANEVEDLIFVAKALDVIQGTKKLTVSGIEKDISSSNGKTAAAVLTEAILTEPGFGHHIITECLKAAGFGHVRWT